MARETDSGDQLLDDLDDFMQAGPPPKRPGDDLNVIDASAAEVEGVDRSKRKKRLLVASIAAALLIGSVSTLALRDPGPAGSPEAATEVLEAIEAPAVPAASMSDAVLPGIGNIVDAGPESGDATSDGESVSPDADPVPMQADSAHEGELASVEVTPPVEPGEVFAENEDLKAKLEALERELHAESTKRDALAADIVKLKAERDAALAKARQAPAQPSVTPDKTRLMLVTSLADGAVMRDPSGSEVIVPLGAQIQIDPRTGKASVGG